MKRAEIKNIEPDYIHSSNAVFTFMSKAEYLEKVLADKCLYPRYCEENIEYLKLMYEGRKIDTIAVLQKCFCDIPLHRITEKFPLAVIDEKSLLDDVRQALSEGSTHTDFYGEYGIAFAKSWAQSKNLQPVQYINPKSIVSNQFTGMFEYVSNQDDVDDLIVSDIIGRLAFFKPLYGEMTRIISDRKISVLKNFYDECEWRFVPREEELDKYNISSIIFDEETKKLSKEISDRLSGGEYRQLSIDFKFQDIRYLIVPNNAARTKLIDFLTAFQLKNMDENMERYLLISKILVLEDIKKDF